MMERYFKPSVDAPMESAEDGDYVFFTDMQAALAAKDARIKELEKSVKWETLCHLQQQLAAKDQQVAAWQMAYEGVQRQLAEKDQLIKELEEHERQTHERLGKILGTDDSLEECARRLRGELQYAKQTAVQDFIHGRSKLCLICGAKEPCVLKDDPSSPCTFDPTPIELLEYNRKLRELLAVKDARIKELEDWKRIVEGTGNDREAVIRMAATEYTKTAVQTWKDHTAKLEQQLAARDQELARVKGEIARLSELLWGARCVYCGEIVGRDKQNQDIADDVLRQHVLTCPKHPVARLKHQFDTLLGEAVWAMEYVLHVTATPNTYAGQRAAAFLSRPDVRERQERKLDGYAGGSLNRELDMQDAAREEGRQKETT